MTNNEQVSERKYFVLLITGEERPDLQSHMHYININDNKYGGTTAIRVPNTFTFRDVIKQYGALKSIPNIDAYEWNIQIPTLKLRIPSSPLLSWLSGATWTTIEDEQQCLKEIIDPANKEIQCKLEFYMVHNVM